MPLYGSLCLWQLHRERHGGNLYLSKLSVKFKMFAAAACGDLQRVCRAEFEPGLTLLRPIHSPIGVQASSTRGCEEFDLCINFG